MLQDIAVFLAVAAILHSLNIKKREAGRVFVRCRPFNKGLSNSGCDRLIAGLLQNGIYRADTRSAPTEYRTSVGAELVSALVLQQPLR